MKRTWHVWHDADEDKELFSGSHTACLKWAKHKGGRKWWTNGYHVGYYL